MMPYILIGYVKVMYISTVMFNCFVVFYKMQTIVLQASLLLGNVQTRMFAQQINVLQASLLVGKRQQFNVQTEMFAQQFAFPVF